MAKPETSGKTAPSPWVARFAPLIDKDLNKHYQCVDIAAGSGRHSRLLLELGLAVLAVDRETEALNGLARRYPGLRVEVQDLELADRPWPPDAARFSAIVVTNYLHRPLLIRLPDLLAPGGLLIYETFSRDNLRHRRPRNPDFLLEAGELLELCRGRLRVLAYEDLEVQDPRPAALQRVAAQKVAG